MTPRKETEEFDIANHVFCVDEAIHGMLHHKTIIVPSAFMRLCTSAQKLLPTPLLMPIVARQQKKKLG